MKKKVKFIDLFAGMGGLRIGFEKAFQARGFQTECVMTSEIKKHAIEALNYNFQHHKFVGDITKVDEKSIEDFDFLLAGFPCQPFSSAGNRLGFDDTRGTLFFDVARILKEKKPYGFLLENVEGLVTHDNGKTLDTILNVLNELDYNVNWKLLDSKDFGVAQSRNRVYIVGTKNNKVNLDNFEKNSAILDDILESGLETVDSHFTRCLFSHYNPEELYGKAIKDKRGGKANIHSWDIGLKGEVNSEQKKLLEQIFKERRKKKWAEEIGIKWMDGMPLTLNQIKTFNDSENLKELLDDLVDKGYLKLEYPREEREILKEDGKTVRKRVPDETKELGYNIVAGKLSFEFTKILDPRGIAPTLVAMDVSKLGVIDMGGLRKLSLREGLRLCGYPEEYSLNCLDNVKDGFDLLGNTVVINVVKAVVNRIVDAYES
ncbi:DNA (cytosine-5-)-methyltransferase [Clostridium perfringens]|uniref:DNA (cytosine-5-)-methyltransferase n=1 Tax=Clostridium perfringens TaxID=1502 RepID=UPI00096A53A0|nr:DNA (cytosine-5-)-methyltransferase [Clostridium perfringens]MDK0760480.1 DNA (cytosine-5-)-methyltransferase [Clostridium perfringens]NGU41693.1 DNA (cytosine-5-)-methyltransferase [Clostridium perfringens]PWX67915.1 DNA (cytosine-5-)-methyltransferase [Clostridium perfringens]